MAAKRCHLTHQAAAEESGVVVLQLVLPRGHVGRAPQGINLQAHADVAAQASDNLQACLVAVGGTGVELHVADLLALRVRLQDHVNGTRHGYRRCEPKGTRQLNTVVRPG